MQRVGSILAWLLLLRQTGFEYDGMVRGSQLTTACALLVRRVTMTPRSHCHQTALSPNRQRASEGTHKHDG